MPSTHSSLYYHVVFSTKHRAPVLQKENWERIHAYLGGLISGKQIKGVPCKVGGVENHIHMAIGLNPSHRLCDVMKEVKSRSSLWMKTDLGIADFSWQIGYGAFTFGAPDLRQVVSYVENQDTHHHGGDGHTGQTFEHEYVAMLKRGLVEYNEEYLW